MSWAHLYAVNYPEPGKRPLSSTTPTIIEHEDGSFYLAIGGSGGSRIFPAVFQVILNMDWGMDASAAIEYGRIHDQLYPLMADVDSVYSDEIIAGLREKGHNVTGVLRSVSGQRAMVLTLAIIPVSDINRIASVVQVVSKKGDNIYGKRLHYFYQRYF